jgi:hypothetical protein
MQNLYRMKRLIYFLFILAALFINACKPPVVFDKPQPDDVGALSEFPARIQGQFVSIDDSSVLEITANAVIRKYDFDMKIHISQLDSNQQLIGDTLFSVKTSEGAFVLIEGDSLVQHIKEVDTLFAMDEVNVLKKFKGYYFLNIYISPLWQVKKLELKRGMLILSSINKKEELDQLRILTETTQDTAIYKFSPTRYQFKKFVLNKRFRDSEEFVKIHN